MAENDDQKAGEPQPEAVIEERPFDARHFDDVAAGADQVVGMALRVLVTNHPGYQFAVLKGAMTAILRHYFGYCVRPPLVATVRDAMQAITPIINQQGEALLKAVDKNRH